jgi:uncharacterized protein (DUF1697 family)
MAVMAALLRGVNVGGRGKLPMADLRAMIEGCGHHDVSTYIQSGNAVFSSGSANTRSVAADLEAAIVERFSMNVAVVVRTKSELKAIVKANPYLKRGEDPSLLHVVFLPGAASASLEGIRVEAPEEMVAIGQQLHLFLPNGVGRSKLAAELARPKGPGGTMRNWRTITKLIELADAIT